MYPEGNACWPLQTTTPITHARFYYLGEIKSCTAFPSARPTKSNEHRKIGQPLISLPTKLLDRWPWLNFFQTAANLPPWQPWHHVLHKQLIQQLVNSFGIEGREKQTHTNAERNYPAPALQSPPLARDGFPGGGGSERGGRGVWLGPPSSLGSPMVPAEGGPKMIFKLKSCWGRSKILAVSLQHWKGRRGGVHPLLLRYTPVLIHPAGGDGHQVTVPPPPKSSIT